MADDFEIAQQIVNSIQDAEANDQAALADELRAILAEINGRLAANAWAWVEA